MVSRARIREFGKFCKISCYPGCGLVGVKESIIKPKRIATVAENGGDGEQKIL